jgi:hypothetical protein
MDRLIVYRVDIDDLSGDPIFDLKLRDFDRSYDVSGLKCVTVILEERFGDPDTSILTETSLLCTSIFSVTKSTD